jgi:ABC-2 type transport system permease protein
MITMSLIRLVIGVVPVTFLAMFFFGFNFWGLGIALGAFFANLLLTSWAIGLLCAGLVLRNGLGAEGLTWSIMFLFLPLTCVYYPVATLAGLAATIFPGLCRRPRCSRACGRWSWSRRSGAT